MIEYTRTPLPAHGGEKSSLRLIPAVKLGTKVRTLRQKTPVVLDAGEWIAGLREVKRERDVAGYFEAAGSLAITVICMAAARYT